MAAGAPSVTLQPAASNSLTARVSDAAGNTTTSGAVVYTLSTTGPTVTEALVSDTGTSATDHVTTNPALNGTGLANTVVQFTIDGVVSATTVTTDAQGAWSFTPSGLANGAHTIVASQTDSFGNTGSASLSFTLDTTAPTVAITSTGGPTNQASQTVTGTVDVADAGATVTILDGTTTIGTAVVQGNGSWSTIVTLNQGGNSLTARVSDAAGNTTTSGAVVYTLSTTGPTVTEALVADTGTSATDHVTTNPALNGTGLANTVVQFTIDGVVSATTVTTDAQGAWSFTPSGLANGAHTIVASQTDSFGNTGSASLNFTLDTTAPTVAITSTGGPTNQASQTVTGTVDVADAGATVTILDGTTTIGTAVVQGNGSWSTIVTLNQGGNSLTARVSDAAGNTTTSGAVVYTLSTTGPTVTEALVADTGSSATDHVTTNPALTGTGLANTVVQFTIDGVVSATTVTSDAQGAWSFTPSGLANGAHSIVASQTDSFGNTGSASLNFTLDTTAPAVAITTIEGGDNLINATEAAGGIQVSGTAEIGSTLTVNGAAVAVDGTGHWTTSITSAGQGALVVTAIASDAAGNTASTSTTLTVDTVAPTVAITSTGGPTNQASQTVTGTVDVADAGATVTILDGTTTIGTAVVQGNGSWSTIVTLNQGGNSLTARVSDAAGNTTTSGAVVYTLSTTGPTVTEALVADTGSSATDHVTTNPALTGTGLANTVVQFTIDGVVSATTVTTDAQGAWSFTPSGLANGAHTIVASQTDSFGNTGSVSLNFTLDTTAPTVAITSTGGPTNQASQTVTGTVDVADAGATVTILDGTTTIGTAVVQGNGSWSTIVTLNQGGNSLTARVSDAAGNTTTSGAVVYTLSTTGPTVTEALVADTGSSATDHVTTNPALTGTGLANTLVQFTIDGVVSATTVTSDAQGAWSFTPSGLANGAHSIVASQTDSFGNTGSASLNFTLDTTAPAVAITTIEGGDNLINATEAAGGIQVSGTAEIGSTLTVNGAAVAVDGTGHWTTSITSAGQGALVVTAIASDAAGNTASTSTTLTVDTVAPTVAITSTGGPTNQASQTVTGTVDVADAGATVTILDGTTTIGTAVVQGNGSWSTIVTLNQGGNSLTARVSDAAGNTTTSGAVVYTLSTTGPTVTEALVADTGSSATDHVTTNPALTGTGLANTVVQFTIDGVVSATTVTTDAQGAWSFTPSGLANGAHTIVASQTDSFGNTGSASLNFTLDTTAPTVAITSTGGPTNQASQTVTGTVDVADAGATVTILDGTTTIGTAVVQGNGSWSTIVTLNQGGNSLTARVSDAAGNTTTSGAVVYTLSTTGPTVTEALVADTGSSATDHVTTNPALTGTGLANTLVQFTIDGVVSATTVTSDAQGAWSFTPSGLANGAHSIVASQTDSFGNTGSASLNFTLDTTAPAVAITTIEGGDNLINAAEAAGGIQVSGTAEIGSTLTVNGAAVAVDGTGHWTTSITSAGQGALVVTAIASDAAGNTASTSTTLTVDTVAPTVAITSTGGPTNQASQTVTGTVDVADAGATVTILDGTTTIGTAVVQGNGSWSTIVTLNQGGNSLTARVSDAAGNTTTSGAVVYTLSTTGPTVTEALVADTGSSATDHVTTNPALTGTGLANTVVQFTIDGVVSATTVTTDAQGAWSFTPSGLANGAHSIVASQTDTFGNTGSASLNFTLDTTAPAVAITTIEGGDNLINATEAAGGIQVSGTAEIGSTLTVNGAAVAVDGTGHWTTSITSAGQGALVVTAIATDTAGNTASTSTTLTVDTVAPAVAITTIEGGDNLINAAEAAGGIQVSGTAEIGSTLTVNGAAVAVDGTGHWTTSITSAGQGALVVTAIASDAAGNTASTSTTLTVDTVAPTVAITSTGGPTNQASQTVTGTVDVADAGATVTILDGTTTIGTAVVQGNGSWSTIVTLNQGGNSLTARVSDAAGNTTTSGAVVYTLSTTGPTVTEALVADTGSSATDHVTTNPALTGTGLANTVVQFTIDGVVSATTVTSDAQGAWSFTPSGLANGAHSIVASQTDSFGNTGSASLNFTLDTTAPAVAITTIEGGDNLINATEAAGGIQVSGTAEIGSTLTVNGAAVAVDGTGHWTTSITPAGQGALVVTAIATDTAGNTGSASTTLTVDTVAPAVAITTIEGGDNLINAAEAAGGIQVSGTAEIGSTLTVNGAAVAVDGTGHWTTSITPASQGALVVTAIATDAAGNTGSTSTTLTVDTVAPTGRVPVLVAASDTGQSNTDNITSDTAPSFTIALDPTVSVGDTIQLLLSGSAFLHPVTHVISSADVLAGTVTLTVTGGDLGADGNKQVAAQFSDLAGNTSVTSAAIFTLDTAGPTEALAITAVAANSGSSTSLTVSGTNGTLAAGEKIQISSDGGATWIDVLQNTPTSWSLVDATTHPTRYTYQVRIIDAAGNIGSVVNQAANGESSSSIVAGNLDPANSSNIAVAVAGSPSISGAYDGVKAFTFGTGNVSVSTASGANITGSKQYGIEAFSTSTGSLSVTTAANSNVRSGSAGILAYNQASSISQLNGVTTSSISVTANGTIELGTTPTGSGARPAGILAVYKGGGANTVNAAVFGNVIVDNFATITAAGGDGIRAANYGSGDVTITDRAGSTISASDVFGISAGTYGSGRVSVTMEAGATVNSGSIGVQAINQATAIAVAAASTVSVTSRGVIHSGAHLTPGGSQPQGVSAGYYSNGGVSDTNVNGTVVIDNFANVTADAGTGVNAYNWGNGAVTLFDEANTNVWGALYGITAYSLSSGAGSSGSVTIVVSQNATITAGALSGIIAIDVSERNGGNISVTTSAGDIINSGGTGISASNQAVGTAAAPITGQVSVTAFGTINSAYNMFTGGGQPGGIWGGYSAGGSQTVNSFVHGNVMVDTGATINASAGVGVGLYNFGTGTITATLEQSSAITAVSAGLNIFAQGGGNITIVNHGAITVPTGYGILVGSGQPSASGSGIILISNLHDAGGPSSSGTIVALGSLSNATIQVNNWSSQGATIANSGTIAATQFSSTRLNTAIGTYNGPN